jgi:hydroxymethylglutaryl-CoA lyase
MKKIQIFEVGPRDGFQNLADYIEPDIKLSIIDKIVDSGVKSIQITSFVSPKAIPQMKDAVYIAKACVEKYPDIMLTALVPNLRGATVAQESGINNISYVVSLSESHNKANIRRTHEESLDELKKIIVQYPKLDICIDLATAFGCPFEGKKEKGEVVDFVKAYIECGMKTINLCDTIGMADPAQVRRIIMAVKETYPDITLMVHIHDTRNMGMVNTLAAIESGVLIAQTTLGGLGGCPYAPGASGNLATEDLAFMLNEMGYETGIDVTKLIKAAKYEAEMIPNGMYSGHIYKI